MASDIVSVGNQTGEGWFLTAEMLELIHTGVPNIVCTQPFGCLPNHVVGKGVIKELRPPLPCFQRGSHRLRSGASEVNQLNRLKLMLSTANKHLNAAQKAEKPAESQNRDSQDKDGRGHGSGTSAGGHSGSSQGESRRFRQPDRSHEGASGGLRKAKKRKNTYIHVIHKKEQKPVTVHSGQLQASAFF